MAIKHSKGIKTVHHKKMRDGVEVKPCKYYRLTGGAIMGGMVDGEPIMDQDGNPIPWRQIGYQ